MLPAREGARRTAACDRRGDAARVDTGEMLRFATLRRLIPGVDVGAVEIDVELTPVKARQPQCRIEVDAVGLELRQVDECLDAEVDRAGQRRRAGVLATGAARGVTHDEAGRFRSRNVGEDRLFGRNADDILYLDPPVLDAERELRYWLENNAGGPIGRCFRLEIRVPAELGGELRVAVAEAAGRRAARWIGPVAAGRAEERRLVELDQRGCTEARSIGPADEEFLGGLPAQRHLGIGRAAHVLIVVVADRDVALERLDDRNVQLAVDRPHVAGNRGHRRNAAAQSRHVGQFQNG